MDEGLLLGLFWQNPRGCWLGLSMTKIESYVGCENLTPSIKFTGKYMMVYIFLGRQKTSIKNFTKSTFKKKIKMVPRFFFKNGNFFTNFFVFMMRYVSPNICTQGARGGPPSKKKR